MVVFSLFSLFLGGAYKFALAKIRSLAEIFLSVVEEV